MKVGSNGDLNLQISADALSASESLNELIGLIGELKNQLRFDTNGLSGLADEADKLTSEIKKVSKPVSNLKKNLKFTADLNTEDISQQIEALRKKFQDAGKNFKFSGSISEYQKEISKAEKSLGRLIEREEEAIATGKTKSLVSIEFNISKAQNKLNILKSGLDELRARPITLVSDIRERFKDTDIDFTFDGNVEEFQTEIERLENELDKLYRKEDDALSDGIDMNSDGFQELERNIMSAKNKIDILREGLRELYVESSAQRNPMSAEPSDSAISAQNYMNNLDAVDQKMKKVRLSAEEFQEALLDLEVPPIDETNLDKLESKLAKVKQRIAELSADRKNKIMLGMDVDSNGIRNLDVKIAEAEALAEALKARIVDLKDPSESLIIPWQRLLDVFETLNAGLKKLQSGLRKMQSWVRKLTNPLKEMQSLAEKIKGVFSGSGSSTSKKGFSVGSMVGMSVLYSSVFQAISKIQSAIKEGSDSLVQYSSEYNNSISSITSSLLYLRNAWAAAFAPIINVVAPYLSAFIDMVASAINSVSQFIYALTGKSYAVQAKKAWQDYASTLEDSSDSASDGVDSVSDSVSDLEDQLDLMSFDQINKLSELTDDSDTDTSSSTSSGTTELSPSDMFETVSIENEISDFAKRLREAFLAEDWEELGEILADGINSGLQKIYDVINWNNVGPKITKFVKAFTTTFNSLVDNIDWDLMGRTVGAGINTIVNTLNLLITGIDWVNLGKSFAEGIMGIVDEVNWRNLGNLIGNSFMISWKILLGFVKNLDFATIGKSIADGLNGVIEAIDLSVVGETLGRGLAGIITSLGEIARNFDWEALGTEIANGINAFFENFSFADLVNTLNDWVDGIRKALWTAITNINWGSIFNEITSAIGNLELDTAFLVAIPAIASFRKALSKIDTTKLVSGFEKFTSLFKGNFFQNIATQVGKFSSNLSTLQKTAIGAVGVFAEFSLLKDAFYDIASGGDNVVQSLAKIAAGAGVAVVALKLIGLSNPFTAIITIATALIAALVGVTQALGGIDNVISMVSESLSLFWSNLKEGAAKARDSLTETFGNIGTWFSGKWQEVKDAFAEVPDKFSEWFGNAKDNVHEAFSTIGSWFSNRWDDIKNVFGSNSGNKVVSFFKSGFSTAYSNVQSAWSGVKSWFNSRWSEIQTVFSPVASSFKSWFSTAYSNVQSAFTNIGSWFSSKWDSVKSVFGDSGSKIKSFFQTGFQNAYNAVTSIWNGLASFFKTVANNAFKPFKTLVNGIIKGVNWVLNKVGSSKTISEWGGITFAKGSDGVPQDTLGVVNDQKGSTYKELIVPPNGKPFIPKGRNVMLPLQKGTKIMPAKETKELMQSMKIPHFESGIGEFFGNAWSAVKNFTGSVWDYISNPGEIVKVAINKFVGISDFVDPWLSVAGGAVSTVLSGITSFIKNIFSTVVPQVTYDPSKGVEQWRALAKYALNLESQYTAANLNRLLMQMKTESGGNPKAINLWDSNAKNGTPSKGLMQVIDPTFKAYARKGYNTDIWDPLSNMLASIRYTVKRYGSLAKGWKGTGYAEGIGTITFSDIFRNVPKLAGGGLVSSGQLFVANESGPELVGRYGNRTGVVNNDQITESISSGVEAGVYNAMMAVLSQNSQSGGDLNVTVKVGNTTLVKQVVKGYNQIKKSDPNFGFVF